MGWALHFLAAKISHEKVHPSTIFLNPIQEELSTKKRAEKIDFAQFQNRQRILSVPSSIRDVTENVHVNIGVEVPAKG